jgi:hypothetical protein
LQQKVEQLQRAFEDADDHEDHGRARKRSRTATQDDAASQASARTTGFNQQVPPSLANRIGELEAKIVELEQGAVAARRSAEETLAERDGKIVELENREQAATAAVQEAQKTIQAGLQKNEWLEQTIDELEVFEKRALVADKTIKERETEIEELKTQVAELERVAPVAYVPVYLSCDLVELLLILPLTGRRPGPCQNAAHAAAVIAVERLTLKAERLQREHDAIAQMRVTLEGWMPNIAKIRCVSRISAVPDPVWPVPNADCITPAFPQEPRHLVLWRQALEGRSGAAQMGHQPGRDDGGAVRRADLGTVCAIRLSVSLMRVDARLAHRSENDAAGPAS